MPNIIKVTNRQLINSYPAINVIQALDRDKIKPEARQKLKRWMRVILSECENIEDGRQSITNNNWAKDAEGNKVDPYTPADPDKMAKDTKAYLDEVVELQIGFLEIDMLGDKTKLTFGQEVSLDWWSKPEKNDDEDSE